MPNPSNGRPSWLPPPARAKAARLISEETAAAAIAATRHPDLGETGEVGLYPWPTMPEVQVPPDVSAEQPPRLRRSLTRSLIGGGGGLLPPGVALPDWWALAEALAAEVVAHIDRRVIFNVQSFTVGVAAITLRPEEIRRYFFIQNTSAVNALFLGLGFTPTAVQCVNIPAGGFYEPLWVPQNEIVVLGAGAGTTGAIVYAN